VAADPAATLTAEDSSSSDERKARSRQDKGVPGSSRKAPQGPPCPIKTEDETDDDVQQLPAHVDVAVDDKIRVFYKFDIIYEAKVKRVQLREHRYVYQ
jgi:hypothetical protein